MIYCLKTFNELSDIHDGDVLIECMCQQLTTYTEIFKGLKNLTTIGGNYMNCVLPPDTEVRGGNHKQVDTVEEIVELPDEE